MMEVPQLHGFGPAANRLLEAYKMLLKVSHGKFIIFIQKLCGHIWLKMVMNLIFEQIEVKSND